MAKLENEVDLVIGAKTSQPAAARQLIEVVSGFQLSDATLYIGYPILTTSDEPLPLDAILTCREHGIVIFDLRPNLPASPEDWDLLEENQADLVIALKSKLIKHRNLTSKRELAVPIHVLTFVPHVGDAGAPNEEFVLADSDILAIELKKLVGITEDYVRPLNAAIQQVATIKPRKKRLNVQNPGSKGGILKVIEKEIANLDQWQKKAAIESPEGPQRIRGLAGSGKTVVLALKAAYLHTQFPDWTIAVTFQTQSLYGQIRDLIRRFTFENIQDEPNWEKIKVLHAWGGGSKPGVYSTIAKENELPTQSFNHGKSRYGSKGAFEGVCGELLKAFTKKPNEIFDAVLVDEAQDFSSNFFRLLYWSLKSPKRLVWAYDDLQSLRETGIPSLDKLFGKDEDGNPRVRLTNEPGKPQQDVILPKCYRNTNWALTIAHALGFGIYRDDGMIQCFDQPSYWDDVGYGVVEGSLEEGETVTLARREDTTPEFFSQLLTPEEAVQIRGFENDEAEADWIANEILRNVQEDELEPSDILVIFANPLRVDRASGPLRAKLLKLGIDCHITGVTRSVDEFFIKDSVALSGIYRAKGNECPVTYVAGSQYCFGQWGSTIRSRNILFTAITRSRAWVRVTGCGESFKKLEAEWNKTVEQGYQLKFKVPTEAEREKMRQINRDRTQAELKKIEKSKKSINEIIDFIEKNELTLDDIPKDLRDKLVETLRKGEQE